MQTLNTFLNSLPSWILSIGWLALFVGWGLGRPATSKFVLNNSINIKGNTNSVVKKDAININQPAKTDGDSAISKAGSYASLVGLVLTFLPMLKEWLI